MRAHDVRTAPESPRPAGLTPPQGTANPVGTVSRVPGADLRRVPVHAPQRPPADPREREQEAENAAVHGGPGGPIGVPPRPHGYLPSPLNHALASGGHRLDHAGVQAHTGPSAHRAARALGAEAFTIGGHIVFQAGRFRPGTACGDALIAHELTHVNQQTREGVTRIDRRPAPDASDPYRSLDEQLAKTAKDIFPEHRNILRKLRELADAVEARDTAAVAGAAKEFIELDQAGLDPATAVALDYVPETLVARIYLLDLPDVAQRLEEHFFVRRRSHYQQPSLSHSGKGHTTRYQMLEAVVEQVRAGVKLGSPAEAEQTIDLALVAFKHINTELAGIDLAAVAKERKEARENARYDPGYTWPGYQEPARTEASFYSGLLGFLPTLAVIIQRAFQVIMDSAVARLEAGGGPEALVQAKSVLLTKIAREVNRFDELLVKRRKEKPGVDPTHGIGDLPLTTPVEVTRSDFESKTKRHFDYFTPGAKAPSVEIQAFDRSEYFYYQEKSLSLLRIFEIRRDQINLLELLFVRERAVAQAPGFKLHDIDSWRAFLLKKFRAAKKATNDDWEALKATVEVLRKYLRAFTISTPYNIDEFGDSYLTRTFPRALTGQLIHDCGVYALRVAYALSLIREEVRPPLRFRAAILPVHVGLIISFGDDIGKGAIYINNQQIDLISGERLKQFADVWQSKEVVRPAGGPHERRDRPPVPLDATALHKEVVGATFVTGVDVPVRLEDIPRTPAPGQDAAGKRALWDFYHRKVIKPPAVRPIKGEEQPELRYLGYLKRSKELHNMVRVPLYRRAHQLWLAERADLEKAQTQLRSGDPTQEAAGRKTLKLHADQLQKLFEPLRIDTSRKKGERSPATELQVEVADPVSEFMHRHPEAVGKGAELQEWLRLSITRDAFVWDYIAQLVNPGNIALGIVSVVPAGWDTPESLPQPVD